MKKIVALLALAVCLNLTPLSSLAQESATAEKTASRPAESAQPTKLLPFADARNMTVMVVHDQDMDATGLLPWVYGSGVWAGQHGYVVTCWHVVKDHPTGWSIIVPRSPLVSEEVNYVLIKYMPVGAELVAYDKDTDIAILKANMTPADAGGEGLSVLKTNLTPADEARLAQMLNENSPRPLVPLRPSTPKGATLQTQFPEAGDAMLLAGFPLGRMGFILQTGIATGFLLDRQEATPQTPMAKGLRIVLSLVSNPGNSGGPVIDTHGNLVALLQGNLLSPLVDPKTHMSFVCSAAKLNQDGRPVTDSERNPVPSGKSTWCLQNSGISYAIPAKFIQELADAHHIKLD